LGLRNEEAAFAGSLTTPIPGANFAPCEPSP